MAAEVSGLAEDVFGSLFGAGAEVVLGAAPCQRSMSNAYCGSPA